jgi:hypothetical protein
MLVQDHPGNSIDGSSHGGQLHQNVRTGATFLYHRFDPAHMPFNSSQAVGN